MLANRPPQSRPGAQGKGIATVAHELRPASTCRSQAAASGGHSIITRRPNFCSCSAAQCIRPPSVFSSFVDNMFSASGLTATLLCLLMLCFPAMGPQVVHAEGVPASFHEGAESDLDTATIPGTAGMPLHSSGTQDLVDAHGRAATLEFDVHHAPHAVNLRHHPGVAQSVRCAPHSGNVTILLRDPLDASTSSLAQAFIRRLTPTPGAPLPLISIGPEWQCVARHAGRPDHRAKLRSR